MPKRDWVPSPLLIPRGGGWVVPIETIPEGFTIEDLKRMSTEPTIPGPEGEPIPMPGLAPRKDPWERSLPPRTVKIPRGGFPEFAPPPGITPGALQGARPALGQPVDQRFSDRITVYALDKYGDPVPGIEIGWSAPSERASGGDVTDADGKISMQMSLPEGTEYEYFAYPTEVYESARGSGVLQEGDNVSELVLDRKSYEPEPEPKEDTIISGIPNEVTILGGLGLLGVGAWWIF